VGLPSDGQRCRIDCSEEEDEEDEDEVEEEPATVPPNQWSTADEIDTAVGDDDAAALVSRPLRLPRGAVTEWLAP
jgi:hypothetical protein